MLSPEAIVEAIPQALDTLEVPGGMPSGKVRDFYVLPDGKRRVLITTDRLSVFDHMLGLVPYKGQVLNQLSAWWFERTTDIIPNHFLKMPDPNVTIAREARPILLAVIVRGYITGITPTSLWTRYEAGERNIYGLTFPDGLKKNQALPQLVVTPTTKSTVGHDDRAALSNAANSGYIDAKTWEQVQVAALALYQRGQEIAAQGGLILVDTKYEFGFDEESGALMLIDELHTPDSSRYWKADSYANRIEHEIEPEIFDRELVRLWYATQNPDQVREANQDLIVQTSQRYQQVYEMITGETFQPAPYPPHERIEAALAQYA
ncbi:MAG: phosphoribosylaminoimidazolesuccinocarboxamide synthase [Chloroflexota bacterium]